MTITFFHTEILHKENVIVEEWIDPNSFQRTGEHTYHVRVRVTDTNRKNAIIATWLAAGPHAPTVQTLLVKYKQAALDYAAKLLRVPQPLRNMLLENVPLNIPSRDGKLNVSWDVLTPCYEAGLITDLPHGQGIVLGFNEKGDRTWNQ